MDTPDIETAVNVMRVGQSGIGFSHNGVNGPYESAWTIDGNFVADWIRSGTLDANLINVINLIAEKLKSTKGNSSLELDGASFRLEQENFGTTMNIYNFEDAQPRMYMTSYNADGSVHSNMQLGSWLFGLGGKSLAGPNLSINASGDRVRVSLMGGDYLELSFRDNGDGTYNLIGRK